MQKANAIFLRLTVISVGMIILLLCIFALPSAAQETALIHPEVAYLKYPILLGMYATALAFFYTLYETVSIINVVERESIFSKRIVESLNYIKYCALVIIGLYVLGINILKIANALPPIVALMGFVILFVTIMVAAGAVYLKNVLTNQLKVSN